MLPIHSPQLYHYHLSDGQQGTWETIAAMSALCREAVLDENMRRLALEICAPVAGHDFAGEIQALYSWVRDHITFRRDPLDVERVQTPTNTVRYGSGDCDDQSLLLACLLSVMGHPCQFVVQSQDGQIPDHVYCEALLNHEWIACRPDSRRQAAWLAQPGRRGWLRMGVSNL